MTDTRIKAGTKIEICPYELYVIKYDNMGFPYFYGKWGGEVNMDAENLEKTNACMSQMMKKIQELTVCNYEYTKDGVLRSGSFTPTQDISWVFIGTYQGEKIVVRYLHNLLYDSTLKWLELDITMFDYKPIVIDKTLEERGIETAGNRIWQDE